jgi:Gametolysin peptidase M11
VRTKALLFLISALIASVFAAPAAAITMRTLYVQATWGPVPFMEADMERVAAETDAFFQASSSGRLSMPGAVAAPIQLRRAVFDSCDATALRNEAPASIFDGYERVVFVTPQVGSCPFGGEANPTEVLLNGALYRNLAAHELGHTLLLGHASRWACSGRQCTIEEYGSRFSVMGGGGGDLNAFEKSRLGWLTGLVRPRGNGTHEIGPIEGPTTRPQALVVTTAGSEFWFESRGIATPSFVGDSVQPPGVAVLAGPAISGDTASPFPRENLLLSNPAGGARYAYAAGESFVRPGIFRVTVERHAQDVAALRFRWLDRVAPGRPRVRGRSVRRGFARVEWGIPREHGSGVATYTLLVDGRPRRTVGRDSMLISGGISFRLPRGRHRLGVLATDRAGNRGRASWVRVRVK